MTHLITDNPRKKPKFAKVEPSYNKKFMMARLNLELILQEDKLSNPTKAMIDNPTW
ncbi:MAG: hypothetical protein OEX02_01510 [Cyclobacteriaceae bacterium]|nr:hypothetical protein [Cyclobacteriaceae bacterium]